MYLAQEQQQENFCIMEGLFIEFEKEVDSIKEYITNHPTYLYPIAKRGISLVKQLILDIEDETDQGVGYNGWLYGQLRDCAGILKDYDFGSVRKHTPEEIKDILDSIDDLVSDLAGRIYNQFDY